MRSRIFGVFLLGGVLAAGTAATSADRGAPAGQWAMADLSEPTLIGSTIVQGQVLFTHDDTRMARGEPCTTVHLLQARAGLDSAKGPVEEIASFHCIPTPRTVVRTFTLTTRPNVATGFGCVLTEFQFAGDAEGHRVPVAADAH
jgi:hypothetical protein